MLKFSLTAVLVLVSLAVLSIDAQAAGRRRQCAPTYVVTTAPISTAQATTGGQGYRTYSYEPSAPVISGYSAPMGRMMRPAPHMNAGGHSAGYKLTDF